MLWTFARSIPVIRIRRLIVKEFAQVLYEVRQQLIGPIDIRSLPDSPMLPVCHQSKLISVDVDFERVGSKVEGSSQVVFLIPLHRSELDVDSRILKRFPYPLGTPALEIVHNRRPLKISTSRLRCRMRTRSTFSAPRSEERRKRIRTIFHQRTSPQNLPDVTPPILGANAKP